MKKLCAFLPLFMLSLACAETFTSPYCEFELPSGWKCALEGTEWVCQSENADRKKEAIIIMAAKYRGPQDSLAAYLQYLKASKTFTLPGGKTQVSDPKSAKEVKIKGHQWIDALHLASEVPGFYTRYLATVIADLGMAVTFSVAKDHYDAYQDVFEKVVQTLRVFREAKTNTKDFVVKKAEDKSLFDESGVFIPQSKVGIDQKKKSSKFLGGLSTTDFALGLIIVAAIAVVVLIKRRKKKNGSPN